MSQAMRLPVEPRDSLSAVGELASDSRSARAAAASSAALRLPAPAPAHPSDPAPRSDGSLAARLARLELDAGTRARVHALLALARQERRELRRMLQDAQQRLRMLLDAEEPNEYAVMAQADAVGALEDEARKQELHATLAVRALLTRDQLARLRPWEPLRPGARPAPRA